MIGAERKPYEPFTPLKRQKKMLEDSKILVPTERKPLVLNVTNCNALREFSASRREQMSGLDPSE